MESLAFLAPATLYMLSMTLTPGPNNVMLTASGANYGYWRTLPHIFGIMIGCLVLFVGIALGLGLIFERYPIVQTLLKVLGSLYLLYLAWKIATAPPPDFNSQQDARPMTFMAAALFQFANPKAWVMGIALMAGSCRKMARYCSMPCCWRVSPSWSPCHASRYGLALVLPLAAYCVPSVPGRYSIA